MSTGSIPGSLADLDIDDVEGRSVRTKPVKALPTFRVTPVKQLSILRAWAIAAGPDGKGASNAEVASIVKMAGTTVSTVNPFFVENGFLIKGSSGYIPHEAVYEYARASEWAPETAGSRLQTLFAETWFSKRLLPRLRFSAMSSSEAIQVLAEESRSGPEYRDQLAMILEFLNIAGLIDMRDGTVRPVAVSNPPAGAKDDKPARKPDTEQHAPPPPAAPSLPPAPAAVGTSMSAPFGAIQYSVSINVSMADMAGWTPDRISAFFQGMAQVIAAQKNQE